jgi:hypothetical protein
MTSETSLSEEAVIFHTQVVASVTCFFTQTAYAQLVQILVLCTTTQAAMHTGSIEHCLICTLD